MDYKYPTKKQLKYLEKRGWRLVAKGLAWKSPYHREMYFSPRAAVVVEAKRKDS